VGNRFTLLLLEEVKWKAGDGRGGRSELCKLPRARPWFPALEAMLRGLQNSIVAFCHQKEEEKS
jgi:hypothetical protein